MTEAQVGLARRAVACTGWKWMPGMLAVTSNGVVGFRVADSVVVPPTCLVGLPNLTDPATLGCLLALVREAWGEPKANLSWVTDDKCMVVFDTGHAQKFLLASTEAEALVYALESAP